MKPRVYSNTKVLRDPDRLAAMTAGRDVAPVHVRIKPTNVCNHSCYFCAYRTDNVSLGADMDLRDKIPAAKMAEIVEDLIAMGVEAVTFSGGGEPLIYPNIAAFVVRLAESGIKVGTLTNGSRLRGKVAEAFSAHATWVRVSIDGWDGPSYAKYRSIGEDAFAKVMHNLSAFAALGGPCSLGASIIVDQDNAGHLRDLTATLKDHGVRHVKISPCILSNDGAANSAYRAAFSTTVREQIDRARELEDGQFAVVDHYHHEPESFDKVHTSCPVLNLLTVIGADCMVYSCQDKAYTKEGALGSIADRGFREFWFSKRASARRAAINPARDCPHHCVVNAKNALLLDYLAAEPEHAAFA
jgi:sulfatase maturation enzyme AslB (radical SAM superfamily)